MTVPAVGNNTTTGNNTSQTTAAAKSSTVDYNDFLKLLLAQLKTQDPTKPMESTEFMGQLASFSQVEQSVNMNTKLDAILAGNAFSQAEAAIGRTATAVDGSAAGVVKAVRVTDEGPYALLDDGSELLLGPGVILS
jgi:flagellar basal-body rod modification protein FlgD